MANHSPMSISLLNEMPAADFIQQLGGVYEHSPWVAEAVVQNRPFHHREALQQAMRLTVESASDEKKLALLQAHPEFAGKAASEGTLTASSTSEQSSLSLNRLPPDHHRRMQQYNRMFMEKFGFPGIVAVRLHNSVEQIFEQFDRRLQNDFDHEVEQALQQVHAIVAFRLQDLVHEN